MSDPRLCVVSGISGAGRTTAVKALEDLGYFCVDNLPVGLLEQLVELFRGREQPLAVVIDVREGEFLPAVPAALDALRARGTLELLFLNASDAVLAQRFNETRRLHPTGPGQGLAAAIAQERELLAPLADRADLQLDTTGMTVHELRALILRRFGRDARAAGLQVELMSFGFRYGLPDLADLLFDVRFLPNPHFVAGLRERTGLDTEVARFVLENSRTQGFLDRLLDFLGFLLPLYEEEGKSYLTIAVGCTGGQHRSIAVVGALERTLRERKIDVRVLHREAWRFELGAQEKREG